MNKTLYLLALVLLRCIAAFSQQTSGTATYEIHMAQNPGSLSLSEQDRKKLPLQVQLQLQASIAAAVQSVQLDFDGQTAWSHTVDTPVSEEQSGGARFSVSTKAEGNGQEVYRDFSTKQEISVAALSGQSYRITETLKPMPWKLYNETKEIAGHTCYKATLPGEPIRRIVNGKEEILPAADIIAWYAKDIPVPHGPGRYYGLPGLILQIDEGFRNISCTGIDLGTPKTAIHSPAAGKAVSQAEYDKLRDAYISEIIKGQGSSQLHIQQN